MDKIKEKPQAATSVREKIKAAPKELVHRGLEDGTDRLRTQLRDAAQQGRRDDYGGDQIEDTAAGGMRRMECGAEKLIKEKRKNRASRDGSSADSTAVDPVPEIRTREHESRVNAAAADQPAEPVGKVGQRIKTKDAYLRAQTETQVSGLSPERTQGQQPFIRERGRQAAQRSAQDRAERMRQPAGSGQEPVQPVRDRRPPGRTAPGNGGRRDGTVSPMRPKTGPAQDAAPLPKGKRKTPAIKEAGRSKVVHHAKPAAGAPRQAVKTAGHAGRTAAQAGLGAARAAQSARTARAAQQQAVLSRQAAKQAGSAAKKAAAKAGNALRAIYAAAKSLIAAAAAGGSVVLALLVFICLIGMLIASPFGILFANEPADSSSVALSTAIAQSNVEYADKLEELQEGDYDQIIIDGAPPDWREIVAVFAVKTAGTNDGVDVVTLDADRVARLKEVFWEMTSLSSAVETIDHPDSDPDDGEDDSWTETILTISVTVKTVDEMREHYAFTDEQNDMLDDLLENLDLLGGAIGNLAVTEADAKELLASLPADLSAERREIIETACQLVGKVNYFWGGKSLVLGWDSRWGTTMQVTAAGSSTTGTYRPYGMDCSGYVDWVFYNATGGEYIIGHGGGASSQHSYCTTISWDEALPGDLVFYPEDSHVGIVGGRDESGNLLIIHCASGYNNVVITGLEGFTSIGRPVYFSD
ncbi:NlpC/P60 family protein [Flavonifractor sp. An91]|uniref:C40 family peptidase n=1 Tax=Flavonifractor sp. An91 TaxID=1965665 RepID=UPI0013DE213A|nr:NlpC/P60 family protein [Flavonifractor sp. An91]